MLIYIVNLGFHQLRYNVLVEYGTSAYVIIHVFTLLFALLICIHFQIAVVIHHYF